MDVEKVVIGAFAVALVGHIVWACTAGRKGKYRRYRRGR